MVSYLEKLASDGWAGKVLFLNFKHVKLCSLSFWTLKRFSAYFLQAKDGTSELRHRPMMSATQPSKFRVVLDGSAHNANAHNVNAQEVSSWLLRAYIRVLNYLNAISRWATTHCFLPPWVHLEV